MANIMDYLAWRGDVTLGYSRAGRLVDEMEKRGIVGPKDGAKPRMCLISREEFEAMKATGELT